jgi:hypothetical protein
LRNQTGKYAGTAANTDVGFKGICRIEISKIFFRGIACCKYLLVILACLSITNVQFTVLNVIVCLKLP